MKVGTRWIYTSASVDAFLKRQLPKPRQCRRCQSTDTFKRKFRSLKPGEPQVVNVWQCRHCGHMRVIN